MVLAAIIGALDVQSLAAWSSAVGSGRGGRLRSDRRRLLRRTEVADGPYRGLAAAHDRRLGGWTGFVGADPAGPS
jgi:hypothetical protein